MSWALEGSSGAPGGEMSGASFRTGAPDNFSRPLAVTAVAAWAAAASSGGGETRSWRGAASVARDASPCEENAASVPEAEPGVGVRWTSSPSAFGLPLSPGAAAGADVCRAVAMPPVIGARASSGVPLAIDAPPCGVLIAGVPAISEIPLEVLLPAGAPAITDVPLEASLTAGASVFTEAPLEASLTPDVPVITGVTLEVSLSAVDLPTAEVWASVCTAPGVLSDGMTEGCATTCASVDPAAPGAGMRVAELEDVARRTP